MANDYYSPYKDKSLVNAQSKQFAPIKKSAKTLRKGINSLPTTKAAKAVGRGVTKAAKKITAPVVRDFKSQQKSTALARRRNNPEEYRTPGDNDAVSARSPQYPSAESNEGSSKLAPNPVRNRGVLMTNVGGPPRIEGDVAGLRKRIMAQHQRNQQGGYETNKTHQAGNLDVSFDSSTPRARREAFMQDPLRPTAQIDRFKNRRPGKVFHTPLNQKEAKTGPEFLTQENSPDMGWKSRIATNKEIGLNYRTGLTNAAGMEQARLTDTGQTARAMLTDRRQGERNLIEGSSVDSQNALRDVQGQKGQIEVDNLTEINGIVEQMNAEGITTEKRRKLQLRLDSLRGDKPNKYQVVTEKGIDENENPFQKSYMIDEQGNSKPVVGGNSGYKEAERNVADRTVGEVRVSPATGRLGIWNGEKWEPYSG